MPTISTEHPDVKISNSVQQALKFAEQAARDLDNRRSFYWRAMHFCNAQIVRIDPSFGHQTTIDPRESSAVLRATTEFERSASIRFKGVPDQRTLFYKRLHQALSQIVYGLEAERSGNIDAAYAHNEF